MFNDPIVDEIRKIREAQAARCGFEIRAISEEANNSAAVKSRRVVRLPPRRASLPLPSSVEPVSK
jgi:hypothetical protein